MSLYVKIKKEKYCKITDFITNCFTQEVIYGYCLFCRTFKDKENNILQNLHGRRSFEIIYEVVKTYYPNCKINHFAKQMKKLFVNGFIFNNKKYYLTLMFCPNVQKWVIFASIQKHKGANIDYLWNYKNSNLKINQSKKGIYSYNQIIKLLNS
jgi:hypothetical protein